MKARGSNPAAGDRRLLEVLDDGFSRARRRAGRHLRCERGCHACCIGPFPITRLDVWRLRRGLRRADRGTAAAIFVDAQRAIERLFPGYPGDPLSGRLIPTEAELERFLASHASLPCPVLDRESGACRLWDHRPVACRTYGPPLEFDGAPAPPCKLCFVEASPGTTEACRWAPDPDDLEQALLRDLGVEPGADWETLIAYAVVERGAE